MPAIAMSKIAIITDTNVEPLYADKVKKALLPVSENVYVYAIPAGEENKNLDEIHKIYAFLIENHFDRHDLIVALGGGVVGDGVFGTMPGVTVASGDSFRASVAVVDGEVKRHHGITARSIGLSENGGAV